MTYHHKVADCVCPESKAQNQRSNLETWMATHLNSHAQRKTTCKLLSNYCFGDKLFKYLSYNVPTHGWYDYRYLKDMNWYVICENMSFLGFKIYEMTTTTH